MSIARAYYNEIDRDAAHVLRALIADGVIAPGDVDERSIKDVRPDDLRGYTQHHWFAGGGLWSVAARLAGWPDERPLWTGSCPCQPFSVAGKGAGADDPRHLWPDFFRLIRACRPPVVMGEQVAGAAGRGWFDGVSADLEGGDYACRAVDVPACAVDAPHIRQRLWWIASDMGLADCAGRQSRLASAASTRHGYPLIAAGGAAVTVADTASVGRREGRTGNAVSERAGLAAAGAVLRNGMRDVGDAIGPGLEGHPGHGNVRNQPGWFDALAPRSASATGGRNGSFWSDHEWRTGADGKARRVKPGLRLLVDGLPGRVGLLRIGGNAISPVLAAEVIGAYLDCERAAA